MSGLRFQINGIFRSQIKYPYTIHTIIYIELRDLNKTKTVMTKRIQTLRDYELLNLLINSISRLLNVEIYSRLRDSDLGFNSAESA